MAKIKYFISAIGYDNLDHVTDYERDLGEFETLEEALKEFNRLYTSENNIIPDQTERSKSVVSYWLIQLEKCRVTKTSINCIDVIDEFDVSNI